MSAKAPTQSLLTGLYLSNPDDNGVPWQNRRSPSAQTSVQPAASLLSEDLVLDKQIHLDMVQFAVVKSPSPVHPHGFYCLNRGFLGEIEKCFSPRI